MSHHARLLRLIATGSLLVLAASVPARAQKFDHAEYIKTAQQEGKQKGEAVKGSLSFDATKKEMAFLDAGNTTDFSIPYASVKSLLYEKTSKPRYAVGILIAWPLLLTKSKKHYLTVQYSDPQGAGQFAIVHLDKSNYQEALATAEAQTGKKVERSEEH